MTGFVAAPAVVPALLAAWFTSDSWAAAIRGVG